MPVIVVGADTVHGMAITRALDGRAGERRAFVTDPAAARALKDRGWNVAIGDVSDVSHVAGASLGCFTMVLVAEAAFDERERSFAHSPASTITGWSRAADEAGVQRVIWLNDPRVEGVARGFRSAASEVATVPIENEEPEQIAHQVAGLDDATTIAEA